VNSTSLSSPCPTGSLFFSESLSSKQPETAILGLWGCYSIAHGGRAKLQLAASQVGSRLALGAPGHIPRPGAFQPSNSREFWGMLVPSIPVREEQNMPTDIVGPGYVFYPVMLMMFAFAVVVEGPGNALVRLMIWLVAFVILCGVPFVVAYKVGHLELE
jgi:hypothetical protein